MLALTVQEGASVFEETSVWVLRFGFGQAKTLTNHNAKTLVGERRRILERHACSRGIP